MAVITASRDATIVWTMGPCPPPCLDPHRPRHEAEHRELPRRPRRCRRGDCRPVRPLERVSDPREVTPLTPQRHPRFNFESRGLFSSDFETGSKNLPSPERGVDSVSSATPAVTSKAQRRLQRQGWAPEQQRATYDRDHPTKHESRRPLTVSIHRKGRTPWQCREGTTRRLKHHDEVPKATDEKARRRQLSPRPRLKQMVAGRRDPRNWLCYSPLLYPLNCRG